MINCANCGKVFEPRTKRGHPPKFCCVNCKIEHRDKNRGGKAAKSGNKRKDIEIICPICGEKFKDNTNTTKSKSCPKCRVEKKSYLRARNIVVETICLGCGEKIYNESNNVQAFHNNNSCYPKFHRSNKTTQKTKKLLHDFAMAKLLGEHVQDLANFIDSTKISDELTRLVVRK